MEAPIPDSLPQEERALPRAVLEHPLLAAVAVALIGLPIPALLASPAAAIALSAAESIVAETYVLAAAPALLIVAYQFQNLFVPLVSPWLADIARPGELIEAMRKTRHVLRDLQDTQIVSFLDTDLFGFSSIRMSRMLGPSWLPAAAERDARAGRPAPGSLARGSLARGSLARGSPA